MLIRSPRCHEPKPSEITPESLFRRRREFLRVSAASLLLAPAALHAGRLEPGREIVEEKNSAFSTSEEQTPFDKASRYNNFYEFGTHKSDPERLSGDFQPLPWSVQVDGACMKPGTHDLEDIIQPHKLEERIYRLRCVEAWSMVIPWVGIPLGSVLSRFEPTGNAKYVAFTTVYRPEQMPGQKRSVINWPYVEGLRMDEAMHPLTLLTVGMYGRVLPNQNGAPLRVVVPWKYGFKSIKSIVRIQFTERRPPTSWNLKAPREYGFYSNVNPDVDHPRWSQRKERRIGDFFKRETLQFNGYAEQVAQLYTGMDLREQF